MTYPTTNVRVLTVRCPSCKGNEYVDGDGGDVLCNRCHGSGDLLNGAQYLEALRTYLTGGNSDRNT